VTHAVNAWTSPTGTGRQHVVIPAVDSDVIGERAMAAVTAQTHEINGNSLSKREFLFQANCDLPHLPFPRDDSELVFSAQGDH